MGTVCNEVRCGHESNLEIERLQTLNKRRGVSFLFLKEHQFCRKMRLVFQFCLLFSARIILPKQININSLKESKIYNIKVPFEPQQILQGLGSINNEGQNIGRSDFDI